MKKLLFTLLILFTLVNTNCKKIEDLFIEQKEPVTVTLDYAFPVKESSVMKKGVNDNYEAFYTKYIVGRILTPSTYELKFRNIEDKNVLQAGVFYIGKWLNSELISLPQGKYVVSGTSNPTKYNGSGDTCYLTFQDTIDIIQLTSKITLKAKYACSLILFDNIDIEKTQVWEASNYLSYWYKPTLLKTENFYHMFLINKEALGNVPRNLIVQITKINNNVITIWLDSYKYINGKYYYFADIDGDYILPPMTNK